MSLENSSKTKEVESKKYWEKHELFSQDLFISAHLRFRLRIVLARCLKMQPQKAKQFIFNMQGKSDDEIIEEITGIITNHPRPPLNSNKHLIKANIGSLKKVFEEVNLPLDTFTKDSSPAEISKDIRYLDIGTGEGVNTLAVSEMMGIPIDQTYGLDIVNFETNMVKDQTTIYDGTNIPFPDNHFDLITIFQVLHHANTEKDKNNIDKVLLEVWRILKPGGHLVIKEHHCDSLITRKLIYIEHYLYDIRNNEKINPPNCLRSKGRWIREIENVGFKVSGKQSFYLNDPTKCFFAHFVSTKTLF